MTAQEQITVQKMALKLDTHLVEFKKYVAEDEHWKQEFSAVVSPLIQQEADRKLIHNYIRNKVYYILKIVGAISVITAIAYNLAQIFPAKFGGTK